ncbi:MAG: RNA polymerase sigma factor [Pseudomonadota bacterium]
MTDERGLVEAMLAGDQQAFGTFFNAHAARLAGFAARRCALDAAALEDVVQQTMINAVRNLAAFRGDSSLFTWLCQICRNLLADIRRKAARQPRVDSLDVITEDRPAGMPIQLIDFRDPLEASSADSVRAAIRRTVNRLPPRYVRVLELKYGDDLPVEEIALTLGLTEAAVQSLLARARRSFKEIWTEQEEEDQGPSGSHRDTQSP